MRSSRHPSLQLAAHRSVSDSRFESAQSGWWWSDSRPVPSVVMSTESEQLRLGEALLNKAESVVRLAVCHLQASGH